MYEDKIYELSKSGCTLDMLSRNSGLSKSQILQILGKNRIQESQNKNYIFNNARFIRKESETMAEILFIFGLTQKDVQKACPDLSANAIEYISRQLREIGLTDAQRSFARTSSIVLPSLNVQERAGISLFLIFYRRLGGMQIFKTIDLTALISAWLLLDQTLQNPKFKDFKLVIPKPFRTLQFAQKLVNGELIFDYCSECGTMFVSLNLESIHYGKSSVENTLNCPFCNMLKRSKTLPKGEIQIAKHLLRTPFKTDI